MQASSPDLLEGDPPTVTIKAGNALGDVLEDSDAQVPFSVSNPCFIVGVCDPWSSRGNACSLHIVPSPTTDAIEHVACVQYDAIHVGAAAASMPDKLIQKLAPGGRMVPLSALCMACSSQNLSFTLLSSGIGPAFLSVHLSLARLCSC